MSVSDRLHIALQKSLSRCKIASADSRGVNPERHDSIKLAPASSRKCAYYAYGHAHTRTPAARTSDGWLVGPGYVRQAHSM